MSLLGSGGMGRVYRAWDVALDRWVAIKILSGDDPRLAERLSREARAQARIEHPNVCKVYDVGELDGTPFISMQLVDGEPLGDLARSLTLEQKVLIVRQVAEAVHAAIPPGSTGGRTSGRSARSSTSSSPGHRPSTASRPWT